MKDRKIDSIDAVTVQRPTVAAYHLLFFYLLNLVILGNYTQAVYYCNIDAVC